MDFSKSDTLGSLLAVVVCRLICQVPEDGTRRKGQCSTNSSRNEPIWWEVRNSAQDCSRDASQCDSDGFGVKCDQDDQQNYKSQERKNQTDANPFSHHPWEFPFKLPHNVHTPLTRVVLLREFSLNYIYYTTKYPKKQVLAIFENIYTKNKNFLKSYKK